MPASPIHQPLGQTLPLRFRQVHLDFHTSPDIPGIGADFDPDEFARVLTDARVNSITCFARCHHGHIYYQSKKHPERIHPQLARPNLLLEQIEACHRADIRCPIYITVQWDHFTSERHRDWLCVDDEGRVGGKPLAPGFYRNLDVFHPGYRQFLFDHVDEVLSTLPTDGIFFDIVGPRLSLAPHWRDAMHRAGVNPEDAGARNDFALKIIQEWEAEMTAFVRQRNPDCSIFYNSGHIGPHHRHSFDSYTHYELESLPSGGWGYLHFPQTQRYARNLGHDCLGMTGKFHTSWGDFGSFKNLAALQFECFNMLALGAKCSIGDQLHPSGKIDAQTYDLIGQVYRDVEAKEPFCADARPVSEIAVLTPEEFTPRQGGQNETGQTAILGAVRMLQELRLQYEIVDSHSDLSRYHVVVLPDEIPLNGAMERKIADYVAGGGRILASYRSGLGADGGQFALPDLWGVEWHGAAPYSPDFLVPQGDFASEAGLPSAAHVMYQKGARVAISGGGDVLASVEKPYFNRTWQHFCSHQHTPSSREDAGYPGIVQTGSVVYFAHPVFGQYHKNAPRWCKATVGAALDRLLGERLVKVDAPTTLQTSLNWDEARKRSVLHLLHYIPERRGQAFDIIEDVIPLPNVAVDVAGPRAVASVSLEPEGEALPFTQDGGRVRFTVPVVNGHQMVVIA